MTDRERLHEKLRDLKVDSSNPRERKHHKDPRASSSKHPSGKRDIKSNDSKAVRFSEQDKHSSSPSKSSRFKRTQRPSDTPKPPIPRSKTDVAAKDSEYTSPKQPTQGTDTEGSKMNLNHCGCPTSPEDQRRNANAYAMATEHRDDQGRLDGGFHLLLHGYWPKVKGRPWVFDGVQAPNVSGTGNRKDDER